MVAFIKPYTTKRGEKRYRLFWWDPARRKQSKVFKRSRDAERFKRDIEHSIDHGTYTDPRRAQKPVIATVASGFVGSASSWKEVRSVLFALIYLLVRRAVRLST